MSHGSQSLAVCLCQSIFFSLVSILEKFYPHRTHFFFSSVYFIALPLPFDEIGLDFLNAFYDLTSTNYYNKGVKVLIAQSCLTLYDSMDCAPGSVHGFSRQKYWKWIAFPSPGYLPVTENNQVFLHCRKILY